MEHAQQRQSINPKTSKKGLPSFMLGDTPDPSSTGSDLPKKQGLKSHEHPSDTVEVVLKIEEVLIKESTACA